MIEVVVPGFYTTVQDMGRFGYADIGVPRSGVMDAYSAQLANQILGNNGNDAVLEITLGKVILKFKKLAIISISGADKSVKVNDLNIEMNKAIFVDKNDVLSFGESIYGVRTYLAIKGGFQTQKVLGSRSFYSGITKRTALRKGDVLPFTALSTEKSFKYSSVKVTLDSFLDKKLMAFPGPEYGLLSKDQLKVLGSQEFSISKDNSRMGYRLEEKLQNNLPSMLTSAVLPGTVQLTPSGKLIVLMRDCQVTGGYPRILQLSERTISKMAQKTTENTFRFNIEPLIL